MAKRTHNLEWDTIRPRQGVLVLHGYGLRVAVERGHLIVEDGVVDERRRVRFSRIDRKLKRLIVLGHSGQISFEALRWLRDVGIGFAQIDADGQVVAAAGPTLSSDPALIRGQVLAQTTSASLAIAQRLVGQKLRGQLAVAKRLPTSHAARDRITTALNAVGCVEAIQELRQVEAAAAKAYWDAWESITLTFGRRDKSRVPHHWLTFGKRHSPLTGSPRSAANPANAMLNYLYAIVEAEARIAALALGLDPALGLYHADQRWRSSFACDLMEPIRPQVDALLLDLIGTRTFSRAEFHERRDGACRLRPPLTQRLAQTTFRWTRLVAPVVEQVAVQLRSQSRRHVDGKRKSYASPTPLTQRNRSAGRRHGRAVDRKRVQTVKKQHAAIREWKWLHQDAPQSDPEIFDREIRPKLQSLTLRQMAEATGLSRGYCHQIRRGLRIPHARHWEVLRRVGT